MPFIRIGILINAFCICVLFVPTIFMHYCCRLCAAVFFIYLFLLISVCFFSFSLSLSFAFFMQCRRRFSSFRGLSISVSRIMLDVLRRCIFVMHFKSFIIVIHVTIKTAGRLFKFDFNFKLGVPFFLFIIGFLFLFRSFSHLTPRELIWFLFAISFSDNNQPYPYRIRFMWTLFYLVILNILQQQKRKN